MQKNLFMKKHRCKESAADILDTMMNVYDDHIIVDSIRRSATRTAIMVSILKKCWKYMKMYAKAVNCIDQRQYDVIYKCILHQRRVQ